MQTIPYKSKSNIKIGRYPAMPFIGMRFKEKNFQRRIWNCVKIGAIEIWRISISKGVNVFQNRSFSGVVVSI